MDLNERIIEIKNNARSDLSNTNGALFLDRDGVIIEDVGYISKAKDVVLENGIQEVLDYFFKLNIQVFIITNQSGISRGYYKWEDFEEINQRMLFLIGDNSSIMAIYANSYLSDSKSWRKPNPGMILSASQKYNINKHKSIFIGDRLSDMIAGCKSGIGTLIHVKTGHGRKEYQDIKKFCDDDFFIFEENKSEIIFIENLLHFPYKIVKNKFNV